MKVVTCINMLTVNSCCMGGLGIRVRGIMGISLSLSLSNLTNGLKCEVLILGVGYGPRGVLEVYMSGGGGPTELHIANPKKYTSLKF